MAEQKKNARSRRAAVAAAGSAIGAVAAAILQSRSAGRTEPPEAERDETRSTTDPRYTISYPGGRDSDLIPDALMLTQQGRSIRLYSDLIRDHRVLLSFMYVRCRGFCPATSAMFQSLRRPVCERLGPDVKFISITLDSEYDTPDVLRTYAAQYDAEDEQNPPDGMAPWYFLTAPTDIVENVRRRMGHYDPDPVIDADRTQHASLFTFGNDCTNRWATMPVGLPKDQTLSALMRFMGTTFAERYSMLPRPS